MDQPQSLSGCTVLVLRGLACWCSQRMCLLTSCDALMTQVKKHPEEWLLFFVQQPLDLLTAFIHHEART